MRLISQILFTFVSILAACSCEAWIRDIQKVDIQELQITECLLPEDHPLQDELKNLFKNPKMFKSNDHFKRAGFYPFNKPKKAFMVASHPSIENYLFKKYTNEIPSQQQVRQYVRRIRAARTLEKFIHINQLKHIVVPQKWLYSLPKRFSNSQTNEKSYILIVEKMDICSGDNDFDEEMAKKYYNMDFDILKELCIVLYYFRGLDSSLRNMPFTHQNQIAFIDTEHWKDVDRIFLRHVMFYLSPEQRRYALAILEELQAKDNR